MAKISAGGGQLNLVYVNDNDPGYTRKPWGRGFSYFHPDGMRVRDKGLRERFTALAIPPAWTDVWICLEPHGHIQVTGRDDADRKQYIYHPAWVEMQNQAKFERVHQFGLALADIRAHVDADLRKHKLSRAKVLALTISLLDETYMRIGNSSYTAENGSFGLTTLRDEHANVSGTHVKFKFTGKSGVDRSINLKDRRLARLVKACQELPGQRLFQYVDEEGEVQTVNSSDVNDYLRQIAGEEFSAKDFRTWAGTVQAVRALQKLGDPENEQEGEKNIVEAVKEVAETLGNTPAICRKYYIHPAVFDAYLSGDLVKTYRGEYKTNEANVNAVCEATALCVLNMMGYGKFA